MHTFNLFEPWPPLPWSGVGFQCGSPALPRPAYGGVLHTAPLPPPFMVQSKCSYLSQEGGGGDPLDLIHATLCGEEQLHHQGQPGACEPCHGTGKEARGQELGP